MLSVQMSPVSVVILKVVPEFGRVSVALRCWNTQKDIIATIQILPLWLTKYNGEKWRYDGLYLQLNTRIDLDVNKSHLKG